MTGRAGKILARLQGGARDELRGAPAVAPTDPAEGK